MKLSNGTLVLFIPLVLIGLYSIVWGRNKFLRLSANFVATIYLLYSALSLYFSLISESTVVILIVCAVIMFIMGSVKFNVNVTEGPRIRRHRHEDATSYWHVVALIYMPSSLALYLLGMHKMITVSNVIAYLLWAITGACLYIGLLNIASILNLEDPKKDSINQKIPMPICRFLISPVKILGRLILAIIPGFLLVPSFRHKYYSVSLNSKACSFKHALLLVFPLLVAGMVGGLLGGIQQASAPGGWVLGGSLLFGFMFFPPGVVGWARYAGKFP